MGGRKVGTSDPMSLYMMKLYQEISNEFMFNFTATFIICMLYI